jgi:hypothetical protein
VTSSSTLKNNAVKTYTDALSAGHVSLPRNLQPSANLVTHRNEKNCESTVPETLKNGNSAVLIGDDGFTTVKWT